MNKSNKSSLADEIASVLQPIPGTFDPEDDNLDETTAKIVSNNFDNEDQFDDEEEEKILSNFRTKNINLLSDFDNRYSGKKTSRKNLENLEDSLSEGDSDESSNEGEGEEDEEEDKDEVEDEDDERTKGSDDSNSEMDQNADEDDEGSEGEEEEDSDIDNASDFSQDQDISQEEDDANFKHLNKSNISAQINKGVCVRNQMKMWENLLEVRIQLQKCLTNANKLPQPDYYKEIKQQDPKQEFNKKINETQTNLCAALNGLVMLQNLCMERYPETKNSNQDSKKKEKHEEVEDEDEEIPSDTEGEEDEERDEEDIEEKKSTKEKSRSKKRKLADYEEEISTKHENYKKYRNDVIQKWNDKTRIHITKSDNNYSILNQINFNLGNRPKLIKRTQLRRSQYKILGEKSLDDQNEESKEKVDEDKDYNTEIFDDDDFYHQLLRELIEVKSAHLTDPVQLSRQWIQLQSLRNKMKKKVDTKATKGRKIRYAVHTKLVNFMAPIEQNLWTDAARSELCSSLFGKK